MSEPTRQRRPDMVAKLQFLQQQHHLRATNLMQFFRETEYAYVIAQRFPESIDDLSNNSVSASQFVNDLDLFGKSYLPMLSLEHCVAITELFLNAYIQAILRENPQPLAQLKPNGHYSEVIDPARPDLEEMIQRRIRNLFYDKPADWFKFAKRVLSLTSADGQPIPSIDDVARFAEIKATRDIYIHNEGRVNQEYLNKAGANAREQLGERPPLDKSYAMASMAFLYDFCQGLCRAAVNYYWEPLPNPPAT